MKTLIVSPYLHPEGGGLERYADSVARGLAADGHEVTLVGHVTAMAGESTRDGVRRVPVRPSLRLSNAPLGWRMLTTVRRLLKHERFDVVNVHTPVPGPAELAALAAALSRVPYTITYHAGRLESQWPILGMAAAAHRHTFEKLLIAGAASRIAVSPYVAEHVFGGKPAFVAPPGVDTRRFRPVAEAIPGRILFVGPVSRAYAWKGLPTLRDAFLRVADEFEQAHLRVVGDGDLIGEYRAWAADAGFASRVEFAGRVDDAQLVEEYSRASMVVLPSWTPAESFGMVLAEANACARPVIGSRVGGIPYVIEHGENGLLVRPKFITGLAEALRKLLADPRLAREMGERGRARVEREFQWERTTKQTTLALQSAVDGALPAGRALARRRDAAP